MKTAALAEARRSGGRITGARSQSEIGLAANADGVHFQCGTCKYFEPEGDGICRNPNPKLHDREVERHWCCNLYDHKGMRVLV